MPLLIKSKNKTPRVKALGVFFASAFLSLNAWPACPPPPGAESERASLAQVQDGDSLKLADGRRVRLIGVNAPELASQGRPDQPLAQAARVAASSFLADGGSVQLVYGPERKDHYGRSLAHVYDSRGNSLEAELLARGLAFHIAVPPNLALAECFQSQENRAREQALGVWGDSVWEPLSASELTPAQAGFQLLQGRLVEVSDSGDVWLELDGPVVLKISREERRYFDAPQWEQWRGRRLEVRGWLVDRSSSRAAERGFKPLVMRVRSPYAIRWLD